MLYLVDANNLACQIFGAERGKPVEDFDVKLIKLLGDYNRKRKKRWALVFDSSDSLGDKYQKDSITVIYTPRDKQYRDADDKILELAGQFAGTIQDLPIPVFIQEAYELTVITDDFEILEKIKNLKESSRRPLYTQKASDLALRIKAWSGGGIDTGPADGRDLSEDDRDHINDELLKLWT
jgi:hypothetical protein